MNHSVEIDWPQECIECERRMGMKYTRLFPLLGKEVRIPSGRGVLLQVFEKRVMVKVWDKEKNEDKGVFLTPNQVFPIATEVV